MGTVRYISRLADLTANLIEITNHYSDCESDEYSYIRKGNEVTSAWLTRLGFGYKAILGRTVSYVRVFDLFPMEDDTATKYPQYFDDQLIVAALNKKYETLKNDWEETSMQFHKLTRSKLNIVEIFQRRAEAGSFSAQLHASLSSELDDIHNSVADSIERLAGSYKEYSDLLNSIIGYLNEETIAPPPVAQPDEEDFVKNEVWLDESR